MWWTLIQCFSILDTTHDIHIETLLIGFEIIIFHSHYHHHQHYSSWRCILNITIQNIFKCLKQASQINETDDFSIHFNISFDLLEFCTVIALSATKIPIDYNAQQKQNKTKMIVEHTTSTTATWLSVWCEKRASLQLVYRCVVADWWRIFVVQLKSATKSTITVVWVKVIRLHCRMFFFSVLLPFCICCKRKCVKFSIDV